MQIMNKISVRVALVAPMVAMWSSMALSDEVSASQVDIEEVVVTGSLLHRNIDSDASPLHVVSAERLAELPVLSIGEAINGLLGVSTADYGSGVGQPVVRGLSGSRVRVLQNGLVARDVSILGGDHINEVDLTDAQQVEIMRGPASLFFANGTIGGVVNVVDHSIAREDIVAPEFRLSGEAQSVNDGDALSLAFRNNLGGINFSYAGSFSNLNDYEIPNGALVDEEHHEDHDEADHHDEDEDGDEDHSEEKFLSRLANSDTQRETHQLGFSKTGDWGYVGLSYAQQESVYGIPVHADEHGDEHDEDAHDDEDHEGEDHDDELADHDDDHHGEHGEDERIFSSTESKVTTLEGRFDVAASLLNSVSFHFRNSDYELVEQHSEEHEGHESDDHEEHEGHEEGPTAFSNQSNEFGFKFNLDNDKGSHRIVLNFADEKIAIIGEEAFLNPNKSREMTAGYYFSREFVNSIHLDFGARLDKINRRGSLVHHEEEHDDEEHDDEDHDDHHEEGEIEEYDLDFTATSFAGTISRSIGENIDVSLGLASVERTPSAVELFIDGPHLAAQRYEVGDVTLAPERSRNAELSIAYQRGAVFSKFTVFNNQIDDYIYLRDSTEMDHDDEHDHGSLILGNYVQADARFTGFEFEVGTEFELPLGLIRLSLGRDQTKAEFDDGAYVPRIAPARNLLEIEGNFGQFDASIRYQDVDRQNRTAQNELATAGYESLNMSLSTTLDLGSVAVQATLFGRNLLDDIARRHTSFVKEQAPLPGRNIGLKLTLKR